jgi:pyruvate dehydrogenase E2 component (dihydrolipoamide acetyltransferase)
MTEILMPKLSDSMEQGLILQWLLEDGQEVAEGDELLEIETDKATMVWPAEDAGVLTIVVPAGTTVAVGEVIAWLGDGPAPPAEIEVPREVPREDAGIEVRHETPVAAPMAAHGAASNGKAVPASPLATPIARRLASAYAVDLEQMRGTGPRGRITKDDVLKAAGLRPPPPARRPPVAEDAPVARVEGAATVELTRTQQLIAQRMTQAKATIPHFQVQTEVAFDAALALRAELRQAAEEGSAPSINDLVVKAAALALRRHPLANASYRDGSFVLHERINVGVAVATDDALVVPTVFDADIKSLGQIARETRRLAQRVREGTVTAPELSSATFTVSNLGMYGMTAITPVINPPQAAILGVGAARATLARNDDGEIVDRQLLTLTLSCDHRILYGADAARFLAEIRDLLAQPLRLLL